MATSRKRSIKSASITNVAIQQTATALQALPEREKEAWSLREAIAQLQEPIRTALDRGYSYEEVTAMLAKQGINISVFSLKRYLSITKPKSEDATGNGRGKGKTRRTRTIEQVEDDAEAAEATATEAAEALEAEETSDDDDSTALPLESTPKRRRKTASVETQEQPEAKPRSTARGTTARKSTPRGGRRKAGA